MQTEKEYLQYNLKKMTRNINSYNLRKKLLDIALLGKPIHIGGTFSCIEIFDCLFNLKKIKPNNFVLSKGHAAILYYLILKAKKKFPKLENFGEADSILSTHPDPKIKGINFATGSLGHGLANAAGLAYKKREHIYVLVSDGELMEGSTWESVLGISSLKISNITVIIDNNKFTTRDSVIKIKPSLYPLSEKFKSFGWDVENCNGHSSNEILKKLNKRNKKPRVLICDTIKSYPIDFMMNDPLWHYKNINQNDYNLAIKKLRSFYKVYA